MRITHSQMTRRYANNSNTALYNMDRIANRVLTERKFLRASEDSIGAARALVIRRNLTKTETYLDNLSKAEGIFGAAETALTNVSKISITTTDSILYGVNGTQGSEEKAVIATQLKNLTKEMVSQANAQYSDRTVLGGTNTTTPPFKYDQATGIVTYNGVDVNSFTDPSDFAFSKPIYSDIGMGIKYNADGSVDTQTVIDLSLNGAKVFGCGTDGDGDSLNLFALTIQAAEALETGDDATATRLIDKVKSAQSKLTIAITDIGNKQQSVEYTKNRVEDNAFNLKTAQKATEGVDLAEEITKHKSAETVYNAMLSMGSKVIPQSIFDFIR